MFQLRRKSRTTFAAPSTCERAVDMVMGGLLEVLRLRTACACILDRALCLEWRLRSEGRTVAVHALTVTAVLWNRHLLQRTMLPNTPLCLAR